MRGKNRIWILNQRELHIYGISENQSTTIDSDKWQHIWDFFNVTQITKKEKMVFWNKCNYSTSYLWKNIKSELTEPHCPLVVGPSQSTGPRSRTILSSIHQRRKHLCAMLIVTLNKYLYSWDQRYKMSVPNPPMMAHIPDRWHSLAQVIKACEILESYFATLERIQVGD